MSDSEDQEPGFIARFWLPLTVLALVAVGISVWLFLPKDEKPKKKQNVSMVNIMPPPPPPPPPMPTPPPTPPPQEEEPQPVEEQEQEFVEESADTPAEESPPEDSIGSNITGDGPPDGFGLVGKGGTGLPGGRGFGGKGGGTKWAAYSSQVKSRVAEALRSHKKIRTASLNLRVRVWVDGSGRVSRAALQGSSGDPALDAAITEEALRGIQLPQAPPQDMPMPIVMRITAKRPGT